MSNLSLARIMYGSNEDPGISAGMRTISLRPQFSIPISASECRGRILDEQDSIRAAAQIIQTTPVIPLKNYLVRKSRLRRRVGINLSSRATLLFSVLVLNNTAVFHHKCYMLEFANVFQGVTSHRNNVCVGARS